MRHIALKISIAAIAIVFQASIAFACTCGPVLSVLDEYDKAQVVLIARLVSVEKAAEEDQDAYTYGVRSSRLVVEKVYKGAVRAADQLTFAQGNGLDCNWAFHDQQVGARFLLYLPVPQPGSAWRAYACGRSKFVTRATEDLLYLDKMDQVRGKTRVSGRYAGGSYGGELKVAGRKIRILGEMGTYETITDDNGIFEIYDLPPGNYRLEPELQSGLDVDRDWIWFSGSASKEQSSDTYVAFTLKPQKHVSVELGFKPKAQKSGQPIRPE
jgi:hypothetical protein